MHELEGKLAIITGAARGTGATIAKRMVESGARVVLGDILVERGRETAQELGDQASFLELDVTQEKQWDRIVQHATEWGEKIDVLVNNAAVLHLGTILHTPPETLRKLLEVNTLGPYLGLRSVIPTMQKQGRGSIVNVGSVDSLLAMNGLSAYCTSKWGLRGLSKAAALELGRDGIRVNSVCPAGGNVEMYGPWMNQLTEFLDETQAYVADRAIPAEAPLERIADAVCFFASDASEHCTGVDLPVDGGAHAGRFLHGFNTL